MSAKWMKSQKYENGRVSCLKNYKVIVGIYNFNIWLLGFYFSAIYKLNGTLRNPKKAV